MMGKFMSPSLNMFLYLEFLWIGKLTNIWELENESCTLCIKDWFNVQTAYWKLNEYIQQKMHAIIDEAAHVYVLNTNNTRETSNEQQNEVDFLIDGFSVNEAINEE